MNLPVLISLASIFVLAGCASNLEGVRRFSKDTNTLVIDVNTQIAYLPTSCKHRLGLVDLVSGRDAEIYRETKLICEDMAVAARAAGSMTKAVTEYAKAFAALAEDNLVTYSSELDGLSSSIKSLKRADQSAVVAPEKVVALERLANLVLEAATTGMRQKEIGRMLDEHDALAVVLDQLAGILEKEYPFALRLEADEYRGKLALLKTAFDANEPLRVRELEREFEAAQLLLADKIDAAGKTSKAIRELIEAHSALKRKSDSLDTANDLKELNSFRKRIVETRDAIDKAF